MPIDPRLQLAESLGLALASIYLKPEQLANVQKAQVAASAVLASIELLRQAQGRPEGWRPSMGELEALAASSDAIADAEQKKIDELVSPAPVDPNDSGT